MSTTFHCSRCGRAIFKRAHLLEKVNLWDLQEYQADCYAVSEVIDPGGLTRYDVSLHQGWYCCRFIVMRMVVDKFGTGDKLLVYADSVVEVLDGATAPAASEDKGQLKLSARDFDQVTSAADQTLKVVKFGAIWCPPCRLADRVIARIAASGGIGGVRFFEVDVDEEPALAARFPIQSIPFFVFYKGGRRLPVSGLRGRTVDGVLLGGITEALLRALCQTLAGRPSDGGSPGARSTL